MTAYRNDSLMRGARLLVGGAGEGGGKPVALLRQADARAT